MAKNIQLKQVLWTYLFCCWASLAYAAEMTFAEGVDSVPFKAFGYVIGLAVLGGMAGTLPKIVNPAIQIQNVWLEMLKDTISAIAAGLLIFFFTIWREWPWSLQCLLILLGGAGGTKVLDLALNNGLLPRVAEAFGKTPGAPPQPDRANPP